MAEAPNRLYRFTVERARRRIGTHEVRVVQEGALLRASIAIELSLGIGPIALYRYRHDSQEVWQEDRLVRLDSKTNQNGKRLALRVRPLQDGLILEGAQGARAMPRDCLPTSYWHPDTITPRPLFDSQSGRALRIERSEVAPGRWRLSGDLTLELDFTPERRWTGLRFRLQGADFCYRPA